jgi:hypothetical protein
MGATDEAIAVRREFRRRELLCHLVAGTGSAAAMIAAPSTLAPASSPSKDEKPDQRYRESEHVRTFYRVNRYCADGVPC